MSNSGPDEDIAFCFSVGGERYVRESIYLAKSIRATHNEPRIIAGITQDSLKELDRKIIEKLKELTDLVEVELSNKDYPISQKTAIMRKASELVDDEILVLADSDMVFCDDISMLIKESEEQEAQVLLKTANYGIENDSLSENFDKWEELYREFNEEFPGFVYKSSYDNSPIPPYFSAALVISRDKSFPKKWDEAASKIYDLTEKRISDQIALGIVSKEYDFRIYNEKFFWDPPSHLTAPGEEIVVHYNRLQQLTVVSSPKLEEVKKEIDLDLSEEFPGFLGYRKAQIKALDFYMGANYNFYSFFKKIRASAMQKIP